MKARLPKLSEGEAVKMVEGHTLLMNVENLVGAFLEEYLADKLAADGWYCCWGNTMDAVDFCKADGSLLQIKTSDNSENSSSSRVRRGTLIGKWQRRNSKKEDTYYWGKLQEMLGREDLTEEDFRAYVVEAIQKNPDCLYITPEDALAE